MPRVMLSIGLALLIVVGSGSAAAASSSSYPRLYVQLGPGKRLSTLTNEAGTLVTKVRRGTYVIVVRKKTTRCHFALRGPNVNLVIAAKSFVGTKRFRILLVPTPKGTNPYGYGCDKPGLEYTLSVTK